MKTFTLFLIVLFTSFNMGVMGQSSNSGVFNSSNDYKHPNPKTKQVSNNVDAEYIEAETNAGNYKQQNNNANPKIEGIIVKSNKKEKNYNPLNNPNNYKTQH